jgi:hypothetical protein
VSVSESVSQSVSHWSQSVSESDLVNLEAYLLCDM